jgi:hypothetical protein
MSSILEYKQLNIYDDTVLCQWRIQAGKDQFHFTDKFGDGFEQKAKKALREWLTEIGKSCGDVVDIAPEPGMKFRRIPISALLESQQVA